MLHSVPYLTADLLKDVVMGMVATEYVVDESRLRILSYEEAWSMAVTLWRKKEGLWLSATLPEWCIHYESNKDNLLAKIITEEQSAIDGLVRFIKQANPRLVGEIEAMGANVAQYMVMCQATFANKEGTR
jgi:hypothetical protein